MTQTRTFRDWFMVLGVVFFIAFIMGCGGKPEGYPDLAEVRGTVTVDGVPTARLAVMFVPENGRPSMGITDEQGSYRLKYFRREYGASIGKHKVSIMRDQESSEKETLKRLPKKYNLRTELTGEVKAGNNLIDFALKTSAKK